MEMEKDYPPLLPFILVAFLLVLVAVVSSWSWTKSVFCLFCMNMKYKSTNIYICLNPRLHVKFWYSGIVFHNTSYIMGIFTATFKHTFFLLCSVLFSNILSCLLSKFAFLNHNDFWAAQIPFHSPSYVH